VSSYMSFSDVERAVGPGRVGSHDELVAAVVSALEHELPKYCKRNLVQYALRPMMGRTWGAAGGPTSGWATW